MLCRIRKSPIRLKIRLKKILPFYQFPLLQLSPQQYQDIEKELTVFSTNTVNSKWQGQKDSNSRHAVLEWLLTEHQTPWFARLLNHSLRIDAFLMIMLHDQLFARHCKVVAFIDKTHVNPHGGRACNHYRKRICRLPMAEQSPPASRRRQFPSADGCRSV